MKCIRYILDLLGHKIKFEKIIAGCEETVISIGNTLGLLFWRHGWRYGGGRGAAAPLCPPTCPPGCPPLVRI